MIMSDGYRVGNYPCGLSCPFHPLPCIVYHCFQYSHGDLSKFSGRIPNQISNEEKDLIHKYFNNIFVSEEKFFNTFAKLTYLQKEILLKYYNRTDIKLEQEREYDMKNKIITYKVEVAFRDNKLFCTRWYNTENQLHREDGPAVEYTDYGLSLAGTATNKQCWYLNNKSLTQIEFISKTKQQEAIVEIDGEKYKLIKL